MALTGVEIFKMLPKTNCKKCGFPTCLAFAMQLAQRKASLDACPDVSEDAKQKLGEASAPPIRPITIGAGARAVKVGEETVLFRHEKKFVNPSILAITIKDTDGDDAAAAKISECLTSEIDRVGQKLKIDALCLVNESNDAGKFDALAKAVASKAPDVAVILSTENVDAAKAAIANFAGKKPLLYGATEANAEEMAKLAKASGASLGIKADGLDALSTLSDKVKGLGVEDIVLDSGAKTAKEMVEHNTYIRRAVLKKGNKSLGYPVINIAVREDNMLETLIAGLSIAKYAAVVVLSSAEKWKNLVMFTLRQNIYTDPQVPMQVEQKVYEIGSPKAESPLIVTTNFSLTYFIVAGEIENSKVPTWLAIMDCEGLSVLTAWAAGKFTASKIAAFIKDSGVEGKIANKELIIPGYVAILSGALEEKLEGWKITVGPREANALPSYLKSRTA
ncbi:acetyl-CoA decarbonylase/synthase complex subunit gamma [Candidatus Magnetominusculus xianensis]|uniref:Acetyl-CoA synthase subunit gamma n=1 Tax=Candidatus Magnetominusculus xianensis TaxID=1748249 RepID=A0ABR5SDM2_9BACT|nr:acetyl-CoA decarbonylase/synthase complex subunit gamma [Candidatus Magnetominusculus xianensis]KWT78983.1 acetyl-CoA synthase subunit gamma [Candidatus Magnetominusculus xianensis]MBF0405010.1 acetyl-CoA decarbonylase/synthase complex subunit gamma [Nitrospirota bacterium]